MYDSQINEIFVILLASGNGTRCNQQLPKQYIKIGSKTILEIIINFFLYNYPNFNIRPVISENDIGKYKNIAINNYCNRSKLLDPVFGGNTRQKSALLGLKSIKRYNPKFVLIHDAARPILEKKIIDEIIKSLTIKCSDAVAPVIPIYDSIKFINSNIVQTKDRNHMYRSQTPQGFNFTKILELYQNIETAFENSLITDDIGLFECTNNKIELVKGSYWNIKITTEEDIKTAEKMLSIKEYTE